jgi:hypothetical protein
MLSRTGLSESGHFDTEQQDRLEKTHELGGKLFKISGIIALRGCFSRVMLSGSSLSRH